ncbi:MAG: hypothetical protein PHS37_05905 [Candidatus Omnitrophica bacterium]|nr:hypothetical protein [Candidatus Omnitrophota bacterium]
MRKAYLSMLISASCLFTVPIYGDDDYSAQLKDEALARQGIRDDLSADEGDAADEDIQAEQGYPERQDEAPAEDSDADRNAAPSLIQPQDEDTTADQTSPFLETTSPQEDRAAEKGN